MSQKSHCTQPTMYKYFYFKTEIKTKVDSYMPCEAMAHSPKLSTLLLTKLMSPRHQVTLSQRWTMKDQWANKVLEANLSNMLYWFGVNFDFIDFTLVCTTYYILTLTEHCYY